jgi:hypothetical protein
MKNLLIALFLAVFIFSDSAFAQIGLPQQPAGRGTPIAANAGESLRNLINSTITILFTIGGIGFTIMIVWGSVNWILSGGDKEKIAGARKQITTAIIGLALLSVTFLVMLVAGQILGISSLHTGVFEIPGLLQPPP